MKYYISLWVEIEADTIDDAKVLADVLVEDCLLDKDENKVIAATVLHIETEDD